MGGVRHLGTDLCVPRQFVQSKPGFVVHQSLFSIKTREVLQRAAELLLEKNKSVGNGYIMPNPIEIKFDPHHLLQRLLS